MTQVAAGSVETRLPGDASSGVIRQQGPVRHPQRVPPWTQHVPPARTHARRGEQQVMLLAERPEPPRETEHIRYRRGQPRSARKAHNPDVGSRFVEPRDAPASVRGSRSLDNGSGDDPTRMNRLAATQPRHGIKDDGQCRASDARCAVAAIVDRDGFECLSHRSVAPCLLLGRKVFACSSSRHLSGLSQPYRRQVAVRCLAPVPLLHHPGVDGDATSNPSVRDVSGC